MSTQTEKILSTSWNLVRDAGSAMSDAASQSRVGTRLVRALPRLKEMVSIGAGLALARRGTRVAIAAVRRNPLAAIAGAVALAGVGVAITVVRRRKQAREIGIGNNGATAAPQPRRLVAKNLRGGTQVPAKKSGTRAKRTRKLKDAALH